ncbi:membrane lipoprotein lipid attachment site-containing protein [Thiomicrorhabdus sp. 6S2-11]|uniref:Membrane lipoprotein lipid attachment site-containing protein n=1 Tax=Thiomicrorhabdus marina TaxID=2818442 RepID=A0ABS3Q589_9GAMM|nr:membrane lipoprotein lipid attachment site-containing protein [Thiomicrorhabdus marina]MBO1927492.1 membrane lipoprotein lipid attachment site-containing protein [Thiomicrorhabdus marina]
MKKIFLVSIMLLLTACSGSPSEGDIEDQVTEKLLGDGGDEYFEIDNFEKTNGFDKDDRTYIADVKYDVVFKKSLKEIAKEMEKEAKNSGSPFGAAGAGFGVMALSMEYGNFKEGHTVTKEEKIKLIKTENGWRISE